MTRKAQRAAARLAAVQALYQLELAGGGVEAVIEEYRTHRLDIDTDPDGKGKNGGAVVQADAALFADIVAGAARLGRRVDTAIRGSLAEGWPLERLDPVLRAALRAATAELLLADDTPAAVILSEYTGVMATFTGAEREIGFANGVLQGLARELRRCRQEAEGGAP